MKKNILFVNDEMTMGGVSRILNTLLKNLDPEEYNMDLLVLHKRGEMLSEIPDYVNVIEGTDFFETIDLPLKSLIENKEWKLVAKELKLLFYMKTGLIEKKIQQERKKMLNKHYDIEFSAKEGFCTIFTAFGDSDYKINWIQVDYAVTNYSENHMPLVKKCLKKIDINIACSEVVRKNFMKIFDINHVIVLHNLMDDQRIINLSNEPVEYPFTSGFKTIAVARFHPQKSLDRLIHAIKYAKDQNVDINCVLIGGGDLEADLRKQVKDCGLENEIAFLGFKSNPYNYIKQSDLFIMSSLYEGFPTIVLESFLSETPVLTTRVAGVDEQILQDYEGVIVDNDQDALNKKLVEIAKSGITTTWKKELKEKYESENAQIIAKMKEIFNEKPSYRK